MNRPLLDRNAYDHPEHFDDEIRAYRTSERYIPTPLESLLFELAGHRCTICREPWLEIHHINELSEGGKTEYDNLVVLCPNCHTRVHAAGIPSKAELRHYKLKQEVAYELLVFSRLSEAELELVTRVAAMAAEDQLSYSKRVHKKMPGEDHDEAVQMLRKEVGFQHLQESGVVSVDLEDSIGSPEEQKVYVSLRVRFTGKGVRWLRYLRRASR